MPASFQFVRVALGGSEMKQVMGACLWLAAVAASAAEIHGTTSENGKPLPKGVVL